MPGGAQTHDAETIRRDVYRLFLALTRLVVDPLVAGQLPGMPYQDTAANASAGGD